MSEVPLYVIPRNDSMVWMLRLVLPFHFTNQPFPGRVVREERVLGAQRERVLYSQPTGPNALYHRDDLADRAQSRVGWGKSPLWKHGLSTEQFPVSAYVGSSKNLKDLKDVGWDKSSLWHGRSQRPLQGPPKGPRHRDSAGILKGGVVGSVGRMGTPTPTLGGELRTTLRQ